MDLKEHIGVRVRAARASRGLTQEQLAEAIDRTVETVSNIERGRSLPGLDTLQAISQSLETPIREFFPQDEGRRKDSRRRVELTLQLGELARKLADAELAIAVGQVRVLLEKGGR